MSTEILSYKTLGGPTEAQYRVLGSRHLAYTFPVNSEEQIKEHIDRLWKEHHNATHVCYAWRLGYEKKRYRINDDGEPGGTAGKPIYGQIQSFDLTNVLVAVVRYFGGTKLGTGGLIDAYKTASKLAIEQASIIEKPVMDHFKIKFGYAEMPAVMNLLKQIDFEKIETVFDASCEVEFLIHASHRNRLEKELEELKIETEFLGRM
ncbi:MAG: IMPACT family protein [Flavobacteriales bacterium]